MNRSRNTGTRQRDAHHSIVYRNDREFCGWPFICGLLDQCRAAITSSRSRSKPARYTDPGRRAPRRGREGRPEDRARALARQRRELGHASSLTAPSCTTWRPIRRRSSRSGPRDYASEPPPRLHRRERARRLRRDARLLPSAQPRLDPRVAPTAAIRWRLPIEAPKVGLAVAVGTRVGDGAARRREPRLHDRGERRRMEAAAGGLRERRRRRVLDVPLGDDAGRGRRRRRQRPQQAGCASARIATSIRAASRCPTDASSPRCAASAIRRACCGPRCSRATTADARGRSCRA